jgi:hypothetical protein
MRGAHPTEPHPLDPLEALALHKRAAAHARKAHEVALWQRWRDEGQRPEHLEPLLSLYEPVFAQKMRQWKAPAVAPSAFRADLQTHFIRALERFDPARGAALNTHVEWFLQKSKRYNNRHQNVAYLPEGQAGFIGKIDRATDALTETLGRAPAPSELAEHLGLRADRVETIQKGRMRDVPASMLETDPASRAAPFAEQQIALAGALLPQLFPARPDMHALFHHTFGTEDHPVLTSNKDLAATLGKTPAQIARMKNELAAALTKRIR